MINVDCDINKEHLLQSHELSTSHTRWFNVSLGSFVENSAATAVELDASY
jgi:hypothetical protein